VAPCARQTVALLGRQRHGHAPQSASLTQLLAFSQNRERAAFVVAQALQACPRQIGDDHRVGRAVLVDAAHRPLACMLLLTCSAGEMMKP